MFFNIIYLLLFTTGIFAETINPFAVFTDFNSNIDENGFYKLELRLISGSEKKELYELKVYNLPNEHLILADGDRYQEGKLNSQGEKKFYFYLKAFHEGKGFFSIKIKHKGSGTKVFNINYFVIQKNIEDEERGIILKKMLLSVGYAEEVIKKDGAVENILDVGYEEGSKTNKANRLDNFTLNLKKKHSFLRYLLFSVSLIIFTLLILRLYKKK